MANLQNQNVAFNYRGILNLDATTINTPLNATLRAVTDGTGTSSPLQLSTTSIQFGSSTGLFWNNTTSRLGLGTNSPLGVLHLKTTGATTRLLLDGDAAQSKIITYRTAGLQRFGLYTNNTAESGANAGSDFAIRAYSDAGTLLSTPLFIKRSTGFVGIGTTSASTRLHVRGDGTNPVARFESTSGSYALLINSLGDTLYGSGNFINIRGSLAGGSGVSVSLGSFNSLNATAGTQWVAETIGTFTGNAGNGNKYLHNFAYTINNAGSQTGTMTGIFLNATETALNGVTHNLLDLQVGGVSRFKVSNTGLLDANYVNTSNSTISLRNINNGSYIGLTSSTTMFLSDGAGSFGRLQLGGTTSSFPSIKRNGAAIDFRLADDSAACDINANKFLVASNNGMAYDGTIGAVIGHVGASGGSGWNVAFADSDNAIVKYGLIGQTGFAIRDTGAVGTVSKNSTAIMDLQSTTKGFLPPRMTNAQRVAITSPAIGLIVYCTDVVEGLYVNKSTGWTFVI